MAKSKNFDTAMILSSYGYNEPSDMFSLAEETRAWMGHMHAHATSAQTELDERIDAAQQEIDDRIDATKLYLDVDSDKDTTSAATNAITEIRKSISETNTKVDNLAATVNNHTSTLNSHTSTLNNIWNKIQNASW